MAVKKLPEGQEMPRSKEEHKEVKSNVKLSDALKKVEENIYSNNSESAYVFDKNGNDVLPNKNGESLSVSFTSEEDKKMWGNILTHNHPDGYGFSLSDIDYFINKGLWEIRAVTINKMIFSLKRAEYNSPNAVAFLKAYKEADARFKLKAYNKAHKEYDNGILKHDSEISKRIEVLWDKSCNNWLHNNAKRYGFLFSMRRMK